MRGELEWRRRDSEKAGRHGVVAFEHKKFWGLHLLRGRLDFVRRQLRLGYHEALRVW